MAGAVAPLTEALAHVLWLALLAVLSVAAVRALVGRLGRTRAGLAIGVPAVAGLALRLAVAAVGDGTGLHGRASPDEPFTVARAREGDWLPDPTGSPVEPFDPPLQIGLFALGLDLPEFPELGLRVVQVTIAVAGLCLMAAAAHDLGGARAGLLAAWALALEPTSVFFSSALLKEPVMLAVDGLAALGAATLWRTGSWRGAALLLSAGALALTMRPAVAGMLVLAGAALALHAARRHRDSPPRARALVAGALAVGAAVGAYLAVHLPRILDALDEAQRRSEMDGGALGLEPVDLDTVPAVASALPGRVLDLLLRPFPWQLDGVDQQLGAGGTLVAYAVLATSIGLLLLRRAAAARAAPLLYVVGAQVVAYALVVGNAGTSYRYRIHVVALMLCVVAVSFRARRRA